MTLDGPLSLTSANAAIAALASLPALARTTLANSSPASYFSMLRYHDYQ
jgi:hypothetical protein